MLECNILYRGPAIVGSSVGASTVGTEATHRAVLSEGLKGIPSESAKAWHDTAWRAELRLEIDRPQVHH